MCDVESAKFEWYLAISFIPQPSAGVKVVIYYEEMR